MSITNFKRVGSVFVGSGAPADTDALVKYVNTYPVNTVYVDKDTGIVYVRKLRNKNSGDFSSNSGSGGSGATIEDVTYAELVTKINGGTLTVGQQYRITDFATVHYIVDAGGTQYLSDIVTGATEPLIVTAVSTNKIDKSAKSTIYPQDVIYFDWNPDNWLQDVSFTNMLSNTPVTGFKGVITFRHDTIQDNYMGYDFRNCKFRRWKTNAAAYDVGTAYVKGNYVTHTDNFIYVALKAGTGNTPSETSAFWAQIIDLNEFLYWNAKPTSFNGIPSSSEYQDFLTFDTYGTANYSNSVGSNHFDTFVDTTVQQNANKTILSNNVFFLSDQGCWVVYSNSIGTSFYGNTMAYWFDNNTTTGSFYLNQTGSFFDHNLIAGEFTFNTIATWFSANTVGNTFTLNKISHFFQNNTIATWFKNNVLGEAFGKNTISNYFQYNTIAHNFQMNLVMDSFNGDNVGVDFTSATHVYNSYNCELYIRPDGTRKLMYYDNSDVQQIVNANA